MRIDPLNPAIEGVKPKRDPLLTMEEQAKIDEARAKLKPNVRVTETPKFLKASRELQWKMLHAARQRRLRHIHELWNPESED